MKDQAHASTHYGPGILLRCDDDGHWRPVHPWPRHRLTKDQHRRQMDAFSKWKLTESTKSKLTESTKSKLTLTNTTEITDHESAEPNAT